MKLKYLVIHCTATPEGRDVTADDVDMWHRGAKRHNDNDNTATFMGRRIPQVELSKHYLTLPSGKKVRADRTNGNGWRRRGYSRIWMLDGTEVQTAYYNNDGWVQDDEVTNGAAGYNRESRHVCYVGGTEKNNIYVAKDTRTQAQQKAMTSYCIKTKREHPHIEIIGHHDLNPGKACPSFDVKVWFKKIWSDYNRFVNTAL